MNGQRPPYLRPANETDPIWQLLQELPPQWRGPIIGPAIDNWEKITENAKARIKLHGLPETIAAELAWMAHWQALDGTRSSVLATNQMANILRLAIREQHPFPPSIRAMDWDQAAALQRWFYATRWGRLPPHGSIARLRVMFRFARLALLARCHDGHWWDLDEWHPRCDPRIPLTGREPQANYSVGLGFAIPIDDVTTVAQTLIRDGQMHHPDHPPRVVDERNIGWGEFMVLAGCERQRNGIWGRRSRPAPYGGRRSARNESNA